MCRASSTRKRSTGPTSQSRPAARRSVRSPRASVGSAGCSRTPRTSRSSGCARSATTSRTASSSSYASSTPMPRPPRTLPTSSPSWPGASPSASSGPASSPCSSSCSCPCSSCTHLLVGASRASAASGLCRTHRRTSILVDLDHVAAGICAAGEAFQTSRTLRDDRVGVGTGLDHVALGDLLLEERVEALPAHAQRIDLTHEREYRKSCASGECGSAEVARGGGLKVAKLLRGGTPLRFEAARVPAGEPGAGLVSGLHECEQRSARVRCCANRVVGEECKRSAAEWNPVPEG